MVYVRGVGFRYRSAKTGKFISELAALRAKPSEIVRERVTKPKRRKKRRGRRR